MHTKKSLIILIPIFFLIIAGIFVIFPQNALAGITCQYGEILHQDHIIVGAQNFQWSNGDENNSANIGMCGKGGGNDQGAYDNIIFTNLEPGRYEVRARGLYGGQSDEHMHLVASDGDIDQINDPGGNYDWIWVSGRVNLYEVNGSITLRAYNQNPYAAQSLEIDRVEIDKIIDYGNQPPIASISCDPSLCVGYYNVARGFDGYLDSVYSTSDPEGDSLTCQFKIDGDIKETTCNDTYYLTTGGAVGISTSLNDHTASITADDDNNPPVTESISFTVLRDIAANFKCSLDIGGPFTENCSTLEPAIDQIVYFRDSSVGSSVLSSDLPTGGLIGHWSFDETSGTIASDSSNNNNNGTLINGPAWTTGKFGNALSFNGNNSYVEIPHIDDYLLNNGTVSLWFKHSGLNRSQGLWSKDSEGYNTGGHLTLYTEKRTRGANGPIIALTRFQSDSNSYSIFDNNLTGGQWHHIVFTFGNDGMKLYIDNQLTSSDPYTGGTGITSGGAGNFEPIVVGAVSWNSNNLSATPIDYPFEGQIDEIRFYNRALSTDEIQQLYEMTDNNPPQSSNAAITNWSWDFDNDGTPDSSSQKPQFQFTGSNTYTVKLTATDDQSRSGSITKDIKMAPAPKLKPIWREWISR